MCGSSPSAQLVVESLSLDVQSAQEPGYDPSLSHSTYPQHRHNQLAVEAPNSAAGGCGEDEVSGTVQSPRVFLSLVAEGAGARRPVDPHLLDPCQMAGADQAVRYRIEAPYELVPEPQHGFVTVVAFFEQFRPAQVGKGEAEVEGGIGKQRRDGLLRPIEAVLSMEAHC